MIGLLRLDVCLSSRTFVLSSEHVERATAQLVAYHEAFLSVTERLLGELKRPQRAAGHPYCVAVLMCDTASGHGPAWCGFELKNAWPFLCYIVYGYSPMPLSPPADAVFVRLSGIQKRMHI